MLVDERVMPVARDVVERGRRDGAAMLAAGMAPTDLTGKVTASRGATMTWHEDQVVIRAPKEQLQDADTADYARRLFYRLSKLVAVAGKTIGEIPEPTDAHPFVRWVVELT